MRCVILKRYEDGLVLSVHEGPDDIDQRDLLIVAKCIHEVEQVQPARCILRKEVIQPQVPLGLPCYDFTPVADPTVAACLPGGLAQRRRVEPTPMV